MTNARDIKWDRGSIEEVRRWLGEHEEAHDDEEEVHRLDYPWPLWIVSQKIVWGSAKDCTVQVTIGFDEVPFAEDYEARLSIIQETPLEGLCF